MQSEGSGWTQQRRDRILQLLPPMARPPGVAEAEWEELLLLEAPLILGLALPGAEALELSEPTFRTESEEEDEYPGASQTDSLAGYSPSPAASPVSRQGFNLHVPEEFCLDGPVPAHASEAIAMRALSDRWIWEEDLLCLTEALPSSTRNFQIPTQGDAWSCSFLTGAYIHGVSAGVMNNSHRYLYVTVVLTAVIQSVAPSHWFTSAGISLNIRSGVHRDSSNSASIPNILIPASSFENGELWMEDRTGQHDMDGLLGRLVPLTGPFITCNPRVRHATACWLGNRLVLTGYHVRNSELLSSADLQRLGFRVYTGRSLRP